MKIWSRRAVPNCKGKALSKSRVLEIFFEKLNDEYFSHGKEQTPTSHSALPHTSFVINDEPWRSDEVETTNTNNSHSRRRAQKGKQKISGEVTPDVESEYEDEPEHHRNGHTVRIDHHNTPNGETNDEDISGRQSNSIIPPGTWLEKLWNGFWDISRSHIAMTLENSGSVARDHLALERTYLAYVRTSLAIASTGVGVFSFLLQNN